MTINEISPGIEITHLADLCQCRVVLPKTSPQPNAAASVIKRVAALGQAGAGDVAFYGDEAHRAQAQSCQATALITSDKLAADLAASSVLLLISPMPRLAYVQAALRLHPEPPLTPNIAATALIAASATLGKNCRIDEGAVIGENVQLGENSWVGAHVVIGDGVKIGKNARIHPNGSISHARIGDDFTLFPNSMIGRPGFGFVDRRHLPRPPDTPVPPPGLVRIPQLGGVIIGHQVEIGATSTVDRGTLGDTVIGDGCKIDNGVQIAHNCQLGRMCILTGHVGLAGSVTLGDGVVLGGGVVVSDHVSIGDGAQIAMGSFVARNVAAKAKMGGTPAMPIRQWHRLNLKLAAWLREGKDVPT
ncbi:MAG: UDP-3-O-(3-hydroxymyristoyl)glucosamine N-acyltransferase [Candidatus Symbiobacter sp.]|nr:UDP-3-O-(3-hydroxymyristoyl)glucosamine N-acyltransferase [Candidatus Symbiobacter sp.]